MGIEDRAIRDLRKSAHSAPTVQRADELLARQFEPIRWAVHDLVPEGVALLVGAPKIGKSWFALQMAIALATGTPLWNGRKSEAAGGVLLLALEDNDRRLQKRLNELQPSIVPDKLHFVTDWQRMDQGGVERLGEWLTDHPDIRLVIIDTLGMFRPKESGNSSAYQADYHVGSELKSLAEQFRIAILLVHHSRKQVAHDILDSVSGTHGLAGSVDTVLFLKRVRGRMDAGLFVTGRDIENEQEYALQRDGCRWTCSGSIEEAQMHSERQAIMDFLTANGASQPHEVAEGLQKNPVTTRRLLGKMLDAGQLHCDSRGSYALTHTIVNSVNRGNTVHAVNGVHSVHADTTGQRS